MPFLISARDMLHIPVSLAESMRSANVYELPVRPAGGWSMARDASRPDAFRRQRRAGAVKDAEGTAKRREP